MWLHNRTTSCPGCACAATATPQGRRHRCGRRQANCGLARSRRQLLPGLRCLGRDRPLRLDVCRVPVPPGKVRASAATARPAADTYHWGSAGRAECVTSSATSPPNSSAFASATSPWPRPTRMASSCSSPGCTVRPAPRGVNIRRRPCPPTCRCCVRSATSNCFCSTCRTICAWDCGTSSRRHPIPDLRRRSTSSSGSMPVSTDGPRARPPPFNERSGSCSVSRTPRVRRSAVATWRC